MVHVPMIEVRREVYGTCTNDRGEERGVWYMYQ